MEAQHRAETAETSTYGPMRGYWTTEANHQELEEAGVPHMAPVPRPPMTRASWSTAHNIPVAAGQVGGAPFPTFEQLNLRQQRRYQPASISTTFNHRGYERLRENVGE
jgi:hypothetical protein